MHYDVQHNAFISGAGLLGAAAWLGTKALSGVSGVARVGGNTAVGGAHALVAGGKLSLEVLRSLASTTPKVLLGVPAGLGLAAGVAYSKLSAPTAEGLEATEQRLVSAKLQTMLKENLRQIESGKLRHKAKKEQQKI